MTVSSLPQFMGLAVILPQAWCLVVGTMSSPWPLGGQNSEFFQVPKPSLLAAPAGVLPPAIQAEVRDSNTCGNPALSACVRHFGALSFCALSDQMASRKWSN